MIHGNTSNEIEQDIKDMQTIRFLTNNIAYILKHIKELNKKCFLQTLLGNKNSNVINIKIIDLFFLTIISISVYIPQRLFAKQYRW